MSQTNSQAANEWALKRQLALQKAESIKAERKRGVVPSSCTFTPTINKRKSTKTVPLKQGFNPIYDEGGNNKESFITGKIKRKSLHTTPSEDALYDDNEKESNDTLTSEVKKYNHIKSKPSRQFTPGASMIIKDKNENKDRQRHPNNEEQQESNYDDNNKPNNRTCSRNSSCSCPDCVASFTFHNILREEDSSRSGNKGTRRPEWNSDLTSEPNDTENNYKAQSSRRRNPNMTVVTQDQRKRPEERFNDREVGGIDARLASINFRNEYAEFNKIGSNSPSQFDNEVYLSSPATPDASKLSLLKEKMKVKGGRRSGSASRVSDLKREFDDLHNMEYENDNVEAIGGRRGARSAGLLRNYELHSNEMRTYSPSYTNNSSNRYLSNVHDNYEEEYEDDYVPQKQKQQVMRDNVVVGGRRVGVVKEPPQSSAYEMEGAFNNEFIPESAGPIDLLECKECGRKFNEKSYRKHTPICKKVNSKRKVFNMAEKRIDESNGEDAFNIIKKSLIVNSNNNYNNNGNNKKNNDERRLTGTGKSNISKWKLQSLQLREAMKQNRIISEAQRKGIPLSSLPPIPVSSLDIDDRTPCPNCGRCFSEKAAERHIPLCKDIKARPKALMRGTGKGVGTNENKKKRV